MLRGLLTAGALSALVMAGAAAADVPGRDWISSGKVSHILAKRGLKVTKIEADDGHWEGEAVKGRVKYDFHVDPRSGRITKLERD